jgi:hypothetical protein
VLSLETVKINARVFGENRYKGGSYSAWFEKASWELLWFYLLEVGGGGLAARHLRAQHSLVKKPTLLPSHSNDGLEDVANSRGNP